jgi:hypothetical protein
MLPYVIIHFFSIAFFILVFLVLAIILFYTKMITHGILVLLTGGLITGKQEILCLPGSLHIHRYSKNLVMP